MNGLDFVYFLWKEDGDHKLNSLLFCLVHNKIEQLKTLIGEPKKHIYRARSHSNISYQNVDLGQKLPMFENLLPSLEHLSTVELNEGTSFGWNVGRS